MINDEIFKEIGREKLQLHTFKVWGFIKLTLFPANCADKSKTITDKYLKLYKTNCKGVKVNSEEASNHHVVYFLLIYCPKLKIKSKTQVLGYFLTVFTPWIELKVYYSGETL